MAKNQQKTSFVILGLLSIKPMSGYDMKKMIDYSISHFWSESNGQLYPTLNRLLQEKYVMVGKKAQKGKRIRHIYSITATGLEALQSWFLETTKNRTLHRDEELLKLFFGKNTPPKVCIELLQKRQERYQKMLEQYHLIQKEIEKFAASPHYLYWILDLKNGMYSAEAELRWCQESIQMLMQKK